MNLQINECHVMDDNSCSSLAQDLKNYFIHGTLEAMPNMLKFLA
jgi:hypothetical protein